MNAAGRRLSESRVRENLMHGLRWQAMETETTAPSLDPTLIRPSSGKDTANDKGVHREVESEGSRMANLWSDEQKSHQAIVKDKVATQTEVL